MLEKVCTEFMGATDMFVWLRVLHVLLLYYAGTVNMEVMERPALLTISCDIMEAIARNLKKGAYCTLKCPDNHAVILNGQ